MKKLLLIPFACTLLISCGPGEHKKDSDIEQPVSSETGESHETGNQSNEMDNRDVGSGDTVNLQKFESDTMNQKPNTK